MLTRRSLRREWAEARQSLSPERLMRNWTTPVPNSAPPSSSFLPPPLPPLSVLNQDQAQATMDGSSLSNSPYTSPGMISPSFDLSSSSLRVFSMLEHPQNPNLTPSSNPNTLPPVRGFYQPPPPPPPHLHPGQNHNQNHHITTIPDHKWPPRIDGVHADVTGTGYAVYGTMPGPPPLAGGGGATQNPGQGQGQGPGQGTGQSPRGDTPRRIGVRHVYDAGELEAATVALVTPTPAPAPMGMERRFVRALRA
jgi:hypothetical protein